jgi:hypothetical protein
MHCGTIACTKRLMQSRKKSCTVCSTCLVSFLIAFAFLEVSDTVLFLFLIIRFAFVEVRV